eukprot:GFUD01115553.1.p1 GENE.GFUD01115553.1~~GFUD01115553.1.p1  ORF type:complete len:131 (+),score=22.50 GFUD01115553.1:112-504(+)
MKTPNLMTTNQPIRILTLPDPIKSTVKPATPTATEGVAGDVDAVPGDDTPVDTQHSINSYPVTLAVTCEVSSASQEPTVPSMAVLDSNVSAILPCDGYLQEKSVKPVTPTYSSTQGTVPALASCTSVSSS